MKNKLRLLVAVAAATLATSSLSAQNNKLKLELSYNVSHPVGSFNNDYIGKTSFRGGTGELSYLISPKFSLGLVSGFQNYYQKYDRAVYKLEGNQTVSAVITNSMDITPLLLRGTYFPIANNGTAKVLPYVSGGAGVNVISYGQYLGEFGGTQSNAAFALQGGAGVQIPIGTSKQTTIKIGATYNWVDYNKNNVAKLNNIGASAGVVFPLK